MNFDVDYVFAGFYVISLTHCLWRWVCNFDLEKASDRLPRKVEEWAVRVIQGMYSNAQSRARVNCQYSEEFGVGIGMHQGCVLSPLLIILGLEARSREFRTGVPWELLYADDLVLIAVTQVECITKFKTWKADMESKGLRVIMKTTQFLVSGDGHDGLKKSGENPRAICCSGVGCNSILRKQCMLWVHRKYSGITKRLSMWPSWRWPTRQRC